MKTVRLPWLVEACPEPAEGGESLSCFDKLSTNGNAKLAFVMRESIKLCVSVSQW